jgi:hypothetical protein
MGYRSDVVVAFYKRKGMQSNDVSTPVLKLWFDENYPIEEAKTEWFAKVEVGTDVVLVRYQDVKWYDGYKHVEAVEAALERFDATFDTTSSESPAAYEMLRIGENLDDIEHTHSDWPDWRLSARREIEFD